jgi:hypothetical protein
MILVMPFTTLAIHTLRQKIMLTSTTFTESDMDVSKAIDELNSEQPEGIYFDLHNVVAGRAYGVLTIDDQTFRFRLDKD